jgi:hypothetical protein
MHHMQENKIGHEHHSPECAPFLGWPRFDEMYVIIVVRFDVPDVGRLRRRCRHGGAARQGRPPPVSGRRHVTLSSAIIIHLAREKVVGRLAVARNPRSPQWCTHASHFFS